LVPGTGALPFVKWQTPPRKMSFVDPAQGIGDKIATKAIEYTFKLLFEDRTVKIMAYNLETVLAKKLEP